MIAHILPAAVQHVLLKKLREAAASAVAFITPVQWRHPCAELYLTSIVLLHLHSVINSLATASVQLLLRASKPVTDALTAESHLAVARKARSDIYRQHCSRQLFPNQHSQALTAFPKVVR